MTRQDILKQPHIAALAFWRFERERLLSIPNTWAAKEAEDHIRINLHEIMKIEQGAA